MRTRALVAITALATSAVLLSAPAQAAARVTISNDQGTAKVDPKYATTVTVSGAGFQSITGGHGGIYVFFGIKVSGGYLYVPDSETKNNQGFQKFVAFPNKTKNDAANGGELNPDGTWSTKLVIPGATFQAVNRTGKKQTVDCRKSTCGIITFGAHGVKNARNETFTPVSFADLTGGQAPAAQESTAASATAESAAPAVQTPAKKSKKVKPAITVDRRTAVQGRVLAFSAVGFTPGEQVVAILDDGVAAAGPIVVGTSGEIAAVIQIPATTEAGTHTLRLSGAGSGTEVEQNFPISASTTPVAETVDADDEDVASWLPWAAAAAAGVLLLLSIAFAVVRTRRLRRAGGANHAS